VLIALSAGALALSSRVGETADAGHSTRDHLATARPVDDTGVSIDAKDDRDISSYQPPRTHYRRKQ
jgi:hypothetical protein